MEHKKAIDFFCKRLDKIFADGDPTKARLIDAFHKSIDLASNESLSVSENVAHKEVCSNKVQSAHNLDIAHYGVCTTCGGTTFEQTE